MVYQDGQAFKNEKGDIRAQNVMDNLIYRREIPVMIGVFINPGRRPDQPEPTPSNWGDKDTNRPTEYNALDDKYARVITEELLPALAKDFNISKDPDLHGIGGSSSGAIAAFTVAWERPEEFRKVVSWIGSFTNIRGGYVYPALIRKSKKEPKPLRVFLQDGSGDLDNLHGNWPLSNQDMAAALKFAGYDYRFEFGDGGHSGKHGAALFPTTMRWLWRDWPRE